jgi:AbrB family looped-hinge helix DNA binding protein
MAEATLSAKNQIVVPREARTALRLKPGDKILVVVRGKRVLLLKKPKSYHAALRGLARGASGGLGTEIAALFAKAGLISDISELRGRTTVALNDDVAAMAKRYAKSRNLSLSKAIAELILRGTRRAARIKYVDGLPVFDLPKVKHPITDERVKALEARET